MIEITLQKEGLPENGSVYRRTAVRGIILQDGKLLMVHTDAGDYKFPGGGMEPDESMESTLVREVLEETGRHVTGAVTPWAIAHERRKGTTADILEMDSHYFFCQIDESQAPLHLDDYEAREHFQPVWIEPEKALAANQAIPGGTPWLDREIMVLEALIKSLQA